MDADRIRQAARSVVAKMTGSEVADSDPLISSGLIDSLSILKLIGNLETELSIKIPAERLQPDDFETLDWIVETVERVGHP